MRLTPCDRDGLGPHDEFPHVDLWPGKDFRRLCDAAGMDTRRTLIALLDAVESDPRHEQMRVRLLPLGLSCEWPLGGRAHGGPTGYWYSKGCRCDACVEERRRRAREYNAAHRAERAEYARRYWRERSNDEEFRERVRQRCRDYYSTRGDYYRRHPEIGRVKAARRRARLLGAPGTHTAVDELAQFSRQNGRCFWCGKDVASYHVDHVVPLALGGSNGPENLVIACPDCNLRKGAQHPMDFAGVLL